MDDVSTDQRLPGIEKTILNCAWIKKPPKNAAVTRIKKISHIDPDEVLVLIVHEDGIKKMLVEKRQFSEAALSRFNEQCGEDSEGWAGQKIEFAFGWRSPSVTFSGSLA